MERMMEYQRLSLTALSARVEGITGRLATIAAFNGLPDYPRRSVLIALRELIRLAGDMRWELRHLGGAGNVTILPMPWNLPADAPLSEILRVIVDRSTGNWAIYVSIADKINFGETWGHVLAGVAKALAQDYGYKLRSCHDNLYMAIVENFVHSTGYLKQEEQPAPEPPEAEPQAESQPEPGDGAQPPLQPIAAEVF
jgi:hypothetical protein